MDEKTKKRSIASGLLNINICLTSKRKIISGFVTDGSNHTNCFMLKLHFVFHSIIVIMKIQKKRKRKSSVH